MKSKRLVFAKMLAAAFLAMSLIGCSSEPKQVNYDPADLQPAEEDNFDADITVVQALDMRAATL